MCRHGRGTSVPEKDQRYTHTHACAHRTVSCSSERKQTSSGYGEFEGNGFMFSTIEKKKKCINKDPIVLAAVSWTEIALHVAIAEVKHTQNPSGTMGR